MMPVNRAASQFFSGKPGYRAYNPMQVNLAYHHPSHLFKQAGKIPVYLRAGIAR